ncbi:uncharacterized protein [Asterias amurensis]|uniref:uncharacterized protein n=1 Tax=Asterias amurensis TaxID=7602 RepID=UPI003AB703A3
MAEASSSMRSGANSMAFQIIERSELKDPIWLGAGGFGNVFKYKHDLLGDVAVKKCRVNSRMEVESLAKPGLNNFIVKILGWIEPTEKDEHSYIVMEYMEHRSLKDFSRKLSPIPDSLKIRMVSEVIEGMYFLHNKNIIHRDLKLENIFVGKEFSVKIGDLGCATWKSVANRTKDTPGTFTHMAPEILKNVNEPATKMSDVYSFGITLWELSTNGNPFEHEKQETRLERAILGGKRPDMGTCFPVDVPHIIKDMMERAWRLAPDERPTFQELKEEIAQEYNDNYKEDVPAALSVCYKKLSLAQKKEEESCKENGDTPDSPSAEDNLSMLDGPRPGPLCSYNDQRNGGVLEKISVPVSDTGKGELPGVTTAFGKLGIDEGKKAVQPVSDDIKASRQPSESASAPRPTTGEPRVPTQESHCGNPETSKNLSFLNQPQSQHQTGYDPQPSNRKTGRGDDSSAAESCVSDVLDPEVKKITNSKEILEEKHINTLSRHIGLRWKELGRELKLSSVKMENIEVDHHYGGQREWAFQVMLAWMRKKGRATKGELATALVTVELTEAALKLL